MQQEKPMIPRLMKCSTCEKAERGTKVCQVYPEGIPEKYRCKTEGPRDPSDTIPECPHYEPEKDLNRWVNPEWRALLEQLEKDIAAEK